MGFRRHIILLCLFLIAACSPGSSQNSAAPSLDNEPHKAGTGQPLQGTINGQDWTYLSGRAYLKKSQPNFMVVQLWNTPISKPCEEKAGSTLQMRITAPNEASSWTLTPEDPFNANLSIFFADEDLHLQPKDNMRADHGEVTFLSIDKDFVSGVINGSFQNPRVGGTRVNGDFTVPFCP